MFTSPGWAPNDFLPQKFKKNSVKLTHHRREITWNWVTFIPVGGPKFKFQIVKSIDRHLYHEKIPWNLDPKRPWNFKPKSEEPSKEECKPETDSYQPKYERKIAWNQRFSGYRAVSVSCFYESRGLVAGVIIGQSLMLRAWYPFPSTFQPRKISSNRQIAGAQTRSHRFHRLVRYFLYIYDCVSFHVFCQCSQHFRVPNFYYSFCFLKLVFIQVKF